MREIEAGPHAEVTRPNEVFKYTGFRGCQYILIALNSPYDVCKGCVFHNGSEHPLSREDCTYVGLSCTKRIFRPIDDVMENL